jgi:acetate kinase
MNKKSGVLGISGVHSDDRAVKAAAVEGNKRAKLARDMQWYQIRKCIGSYVAAMDGVDVIAFTGGIGENCTDLREDILNNLSYLGIKLDEKANEVRGEEIELTVPGCPVKAYVVPTNEELAIARDTKEICEKL